MDFRWDFAFSILPSLGLALVVALKAAIGGMAVAIVLGFIWSLMRRSKFRMVRSVAAGCVEFLRSTPLLVQVYFIYFAGPEIGLTFSPLTTGILALGCHYGAYLSEVFRAGIDAVPKGQWEAAVALNFPKLVKWRRILLPQIIPIVLPTLMNYWLAILKDTPILSAITLVELLQQAKLIGADTFRYVEPITMVGLLFLIVSLISSHLSRKLEQKLKYTH